MERDNIIEQIKENDIADLHRLLKTALDKDISYERMQDLYKRADADKDIYVLGYYVKDVLVGTLTLNILTLLAGECATIWNVAVKDEYRNLGIASKLMNAAEEIVRSRENVAKIFLFSGVHRQGAHALYRKFGYDENVYKPFVKEL